MASQPQDSQENNASSTKSTTIIPPASESATSSSTSTINSNLVEQEVVCRDSVDEVRLAEKMLARFGRNGDGKRNFQTLLRRSTYVVMVPELLTDAEIKDFFRNEKLPKSENQVGGDGKKC
ncbi:hypothetical protein EG329_005160 [Mollisiaceae sp. DMI_Dod_QoI]|nr:hypothetical protein EG329_005160 [Helotiales sp. DMI_Dod_QoI]